MVEIGRQSDEASQSTLERAAGPPQSWPRFAVTEERLVIEAARLVGDLAQIPTDQLWIERRLQGTSAPIRGTADLIVIDSDGEATVTDHKTGAVAATDLAEDSQYGVQVRMYAALARDHGLAPSRVEVRPIGRRSQPLEIDDGGIDRAVSVAINELEKYNSAVRDGQAESLARPSEDNCRWCESLPTCPAVWGKASVDLGELQVVEGTVTAIDHSRAGRTALALDADAGTKHGPVVVAGLDLVALGLDGKLVVGDAIRVAGVAAATSSSSSLRAQGGWVRIVTDGSAGGGGWSSEVN